MQRDLLQIPFLISRIVELHRPAAKHMEYLILQSIIDVFQIEGRGTVVTGPIGAGWKLAKRGDKIVLRTPDGRSIKTAIKDMEIFSKWQN